MPPISVMIKLSQLSYALQTNGTVIDEDWATFFAKHKFLVGLSLDGDRSAHDLHRIDTQNKGTYSTVLKAAKLLEKHKVEFNILTVITAYTARHIGQIYKFFMKNNMVYQQYIPCLDPLEEPHGLTLILSRQSCMGTPPRCVALWGDAPSKP